MNKTTMAVAALIAAAGSANANLSTNIFEITFTDDLTGEVTSWNWQEDSGLWQNGVYQWGFTWGDASDASTWWNVTNNAGETVFSVHNASVLYDVDPVVQVNFNMQQGQAAGVITVNSSLNSFPAFSNATGSASAAITVTDTNFDGVTATPAGANGEMYTAFYNGGLPQTGTVFSELLTGPVSAGILSSNSASQDHLGGGFHPIAGNLFDMSAQWQFTLTAGDIASGTSTYETVPAPAGVALLGLGGLVAARRRR